MAGKADNPRSCCLLMYKHALSDGSGKQKVHYMVTYIDMVSNLPKA